MTKTKKQIMKNLPRKDVKNLIELGIIELKANGHIVDLALALTIYPNPIEVHSISGRIYEFELVGETELNFNIKEVA